MLGRARASKGEVVVCVCVRVCVCVCVYVGVPTSYIFTRVSCHPTTFSLHSPSTVGKEEKVQAFDYSASRGHGLTKAAGKNLGLQLLEW